MTSILVTGASGALGQAIYKQIKAQPEAADVHGIVRSNRQLGCDTAHVVDAQNAEAVIEALSGVQPDGVILTAWETQHGTYWTTPENDAWADASLKVLEWCAARAIPAVFAGSCAEYAWGGDVLKETDTGLPATRYGLQKRRVSEWIAQAKPEGIASARIFFPFSAAENPNRITTLVAQSALQGEDFHLRAGDVWRDFYPTSVAAHAMLNLLRAKAGGVFNLSGGTPVHLGSFLRDLAQEAGTGATVTWDDYAEEHGPYRLIGDPTAIHPYWPEDWSLAAARAEFLKHLRSR